MPESSPTPASPNQPPAPPLWWSLVQLLRGPAAPAAVLTTGGLLAWLGSQLPQRDAPRWLADGLGRSDLMALATLGLDDLTIALPVMLWWIAAVAVLLLRSGWLGDGTPNRSGQRAVGATWLISATFWAIWVLWNVARPAVTWLDVDVQVAQPATLAWTYDFGHPAPAPGRFVGSCAPDASGRELDCTLEVPQGPAKIHLAAGQSETRQGWQFTWVGRAPNPVAERFLFVGAVQPGGAPVQVPLQAGKAADAPAIRARWIPQASAAGGPAVLAVAEGGPLTWWNSPILSGSSAVTATARAGDRVRIAVAPVGWPVHTWWLALVLAAAAAVAGARLRREGQP